jgi:hypothetical protein
MSVPCDAILLRYHFTFFIYRCSNNIPYQSRLTSTCPILIFLKFTSTAFGTSSPLTVDFGLWYHDSLAAITATDGTTYLVEYCKKYPASVEIDVSWKAARAFSVLVFIFSWIIIGTLLFTSCFPARAGYSLGRCMPPLYLLMAIFQGLTFLFLNSTVCKAETNPLLNEVGSFIWQDTCAISTGAKCFISATVFWVAASVSSFKEQKVLEEELAGMDPGMQTGLLSDP